MVNGLPDWPPQLNDESIYALSHAAVDYALSHSIVYRPVAAEGSGRVPHDETIHAPISLLPSPFPAALYAQSQSLQPLYNDLYARITLDESFLESVIGGNVILVDEFQAKLWHVWRTVEREGIVQPMHLGLFRSDYLLHQDDDDGHDDGERRSELTIKQVELNTISSSFGPLCSRVTALHRHLARSTGFYGALDALSDVDKMPVNKALDTLAAGLAAGHRAYTDRTKSGPSSSPSSSAPVILFVVQEGERNAFDQRLIEYELLERYGVRVLRATLTQIAASAKLEGAHRKLIYVDPTSKRAEHVAVVYFRAGYGPNDYPSEREWDARLLLERSLAIKCPTAALQLAGAKKVQQVLSTKGVLESLVKDERKGRVWSDEEVSRLRASFMPMYGMETDSEGVAIASDPKRALAYVLKPQREGGGNNVYREDIVPALQELERLDANEGEQKSSDGSAKRIKRREAYILMKLIEPPSNVGNYLVRHSQKSMGINGGEQGSTPKAILASNVISELGAFGVILFEKKESKSDTANLNVLFEQSGGHLLRTKARESNEGGVAAGFSVIDSPLLV